MTAENAIANEVVKSEGCLEMRNEEKVDDPEGRRPRVNQTPQFREGKDRSSGGGPHNLVERRDKTKPLDDTQCRDALRIGESFVLR